MNGLTNFIFLARQVEPEPGFIVGPIARLFGFIISYLFEVVYFIVGSPHSLGITIILMTIIFRACTMPLSIKAQKSMMRMRELKPELDKIQAKYGNTRDPEIVKKMNAEKQILIQKHDANPIKGCFPLLLQMPMFIGLNFIMRQAFLYIVRLRELYYDLAVAVQNIPNFTEWFIPKHLEFLPNALLRNREEAIRLYQQTGMSIESVRAQVGDIIDPNIPADVARVLNRFTADCWIELQNMIPAYYWEPIAALNDRREAIETFFGLSMVNNSGWTWPLIILPLLTAITMFCSQWVSQQKMADPNADDKAKMQQKIMLVAMPLFLGFITVSLPAGVGLFWVTSQVFQLVQDLIWCKKDGIPLNLPFSKKEAS